jgi:hypothetical protein
VLARLLVRLRRVFAVLLAVGIASRGVDEERLRCSEALRWLGQPFLHGGCVPGERGGLLAGSHVSSGARASYLEKRSAFQVAEPAVLARSETKPGGSLSASSNRVALIESVCGAFACHSRVR